MSHDEFTKLFTYIQNEFKVVKTKLETLATKEEMNTLTNTVDGLAKNTVDTHQELLMLSNQVSRIEENLNKLASETGVKLTY